LALSQNRAAAVYRSALRDPEPFTTIDLRVFSALLRDFHFFPQIPLAGKWIPNILAALRFGDRIVTGRKKVKDSACGAGETR
jgi:hypothetical protein